MGSSLKEREDNNMKNLLAYLTSYKAKKTQLDALKEEVDNMKAELLGYALENYERDEKGKIKFTHGQYTITVTACKRTDIDRKALEAFDAELAKRFEKVTEYDMVKVG